jgi:hypothetical protein
MAQTCGNHVTREPGCCSERRIQRELPRSFVPEANIFNDSNQSTQGFW